MNTIRLTKGDITMRDPKVIEAEIAKLQSELEDVRYHEAMTRSAVHILRNLGWTWTRKTGWKKPINKVDIKHFDKKSMTHIKAGDWVRVRAVNGYGYVRAISRLYAQVSYVGAVTHRGAIVSDKVNTVHTDLLTVVSHDEIVKSYPK